MEPKGHKTFALLRFNIEAHFAVANAFFRTSLFFVICQPLIFEFQQDVEPSTHGQGALMDSGQWTEVDVSGRWTVDEGTLVEVDVDVNGC